MISKATTPAQYIAELPNDRKQVISRLRKSILKNLPQGFVELMDYGMIGYVVPHSIYPDGYHCDPKKPVPFVCLASQKNYISLYHMGLYDGPLLDWAPGKPDTLIDETLDFDEVIGIALDFAERDGNTLVVITGDHETGGVTITGGDHKTHKVELNFSTDGHTADMVPVYALGPGAENFTGIYENTAIFEKILASFEFR
ncbi:MAG TPA: alkaline phosphatase [Cyclobacteriaceae bacterium]|nr:alkaline phosphatase [Cyclobacteriaceae bacterium]